MEYLFFIFFKGIEGDYLNIYILKLKGHKMMIECINIELLTASYVTNDAIATAPTCIKAHLC